MLEALKRLFRGHQEIGVTSDTDRSETIKQLKFGQIPKHVAIIMDGNGRWAAKRGLPRIAGHQAGMKTVREIVRVADDLGIEVLTLYSFSTENWKRPRDEVNFLMKLPQEFFNSEIKELKSRNIRVEMVGSESQLPGFTMSAINQFREETKENTGLQLNFAMNYGSRSEILYAVEGMLRDQAGGHLDIDEVNEETFARYLYTRDLPDPDLMIRTSGEIRISNFMLWQLAYSELWFTETAWPDFKEKSFLQAIQDYQRRSRRYGALK
ncbi:isoprenyl transferase [Mechercharimyces sp. CAU 1602]|uniref:isoprenyl transferase n=1 Tax=Mechercharimyces sp. CAU 1602 TaxID=2973933 RepID=UPI00216348E9|nr:isoprenyl transferase [Mechercharimyces sp. CAU 1602]MCS1351300.1 isoprenyl transferase [Mechercharimyces sp. CAU 1602]